MNSSLSPQERQKYIELGKKAFESRNLKAAKEFFIKADYKDGLIQLGDYYMYQKKLPLLAYGYYKKAGAKEKIEDLHRRMILALGKWIGEDKIKPESLKKFKEKETWVRVPVDPTLLKTAQEILKKHGKG
ncbi:MAG: hypothetical protein NZ853_03715 [Leptospiraceae bacterium]|nr:hypothetical protein [Leptospiraceae bacterium]MDW7975282.1 hypothetical protein [Leptospiraceae bacterium]